MSAIMAVALVFSMFAVFAPAAKAETQTGTINMQGANLREKASTASNVLAQMNQGEKADVLQGEKGGWYKIKYQDKTGYVRADYIDVLVTGLKDPAIVMTDTPITQDPDPASTVVDNLKSKTQVTITGSYGSMYQVTAGSKSGYAPKSCIHKYSVVTLNRKATINSSNVNLRKTPSTSGEKLANLKKGSKITVYSIQDHWAKVEYSGKTGYVRGDFVLYDVPENAHLTAISPGMKGQAVMNLQIALKKKGYFYIAANGIYGNATKAAVAKFQSFAYAKADGIAGPQTLILLFGARGAEKLWSNYRSSMPAQKPKKNGRVWMADWFGNMEKTVKRYKAFEVIDVRTGIHWNMRRFGGWWHADVETMTKADTEAMKKAWGGELNPSRRPVWVKIGDKYYAAGLMGYVHNTDTISTNGMNGQICLHFRGSKIHASGHIDEAHQACILEAFQKAARLDAYIKKGKV